MELSSSSGKSSTSAFARPLAALLATAASEGWADGDIALRKAALLEAMKLTPASPGGKAGGVLALVGHGPELVCARECVHPRCYTVETFSVTQRAWVVQAVHPLNDPGRQCAVRDAEEWYPRPSAPASDDNGVLPDVRYDPGETPSP
jgi:hypothetical protein